MRKMSAALVAITAAIALPALSAPAWAAKPASNSLVVSPTKTKAGQNVKISGGGCKGITILIFLIDGKEFHRGHTKSGDWTYQIKLPADLKSGDHEMWAEGKGGTGGQGGGNATSPPPVTTPPVPAPVARVQVPPVNVRVKPPALLGRDLPEVRAETPSVTVDIPRLTATP